jgi:hypothetical protein
VWDPDQKKFVTGEIKVHIPCGHWHTPQGSGGGGGGGGEYNLDLIYIGTYFNVTPEISPPSYIYALDTNTLEIVHSIQIDDQLAIADLKVDSTNKKLYAITRSWSAYHAEVIARIYKIDLLTHTIDTSITTELHPTNRGLSLDVPNGVGYFISYSTNGSITKFSLNDLSTIAVKSTGINTTLDTSIIIDLDNQWLFFTNNSTAYSVYKLNLTDFSTITSVYLASGQRCSTLILDGNGFLYAATSALISKVYKINPSTMANLGSLDVGYFYNWTMIIDKTNNKLYICSSFGDGIITVIDTNTFLVDSIFDFNDYLIDDFTYPHVSCSEIPRKDYIFWAIGSVLEAGLKTYVVKMNIDHSLSTYVLLPVACASTTIDWIK